MKTQTNKTILTPNTKKYLQWKMGQKVVDIQISDIDLIEPIHKLGFDKMKIDEKIESIYQKLKSKKIKKLIKPIVVSSTNNGRFRLITGMKGFVLAHKLNHKQIPCIIVKDKNLSGFTFRINKMPLDCELVTPISEIKLSKEFTNSNPKSYKIRKCMNYFKTYKEFDKSITLNEFGVLVDGYVRYIVAKILKLKSVPVKFA